MAVKLSVIALAFRIETLGPARPQLQLADAGDERPHVMARAVAGPPSLRSPSRPSA